MELRDKKGAENVVADHLSRLPIEHIVETSDSIPIDDSFSDDGLLVIEEPVTKEIIRAAHDTKLPWYADFASYLVGGVIPSGLPTYKRKKFLHDVKQYYWDEPFLFKQRSNQIFWRCIPYEEECYQTLPQSPYGRILQSFPDYLKDPSE